MNINKKNYYYLIPRFIGRNALDFIIIVGTVFSFLFLAICKALIPPIYLSEYLKQIIRIGWASLPVVGLTAFFTGGALALQIYSGGTRLNAENAVPSIVAIGFLRELGPVLCVLMVAGRGSASIAAEIATMKVTEQIDALTTLGTDPVKFLVSPRIIVTTVFLPILTTIGNIIGIFGGYLISTERLGFNPTLYIESSISYIEFSDIYSSLIKASVFGMIISTMGCYFGFKASRGALGVGKATTDAVVFSSILILAFNYFLTELLFRS